MSTSGELFQTLLGVASFEVVGEPTESERQLRFMGRVRNRQLSKIWTHQCVRMLLIASKHAGWSVDISRQYFIRGGEDELLWGWRVIFQAPDAIHPHLDGIIELLRASRHVPGEVTEYPLIGVRANRNTLVNGKGASNVKEAK